MRNIYRFFISTVLAFLAIVVGQAQSVSPSAVTLGPSQFQQFSVQPTGFGQFHWSISPNTAGHITSSGVYTAPGAIYNTSTVTVIATSSTGGIVIDANVTLQPPVAISLLPTWISLTNGQTAPFTATVTGTQNTAVTWSVAYGSITPSGMYSVPTTLTTQQNIILTAKSVADPTKTASATIALVPTVSVTLNPTSTSLYGGQSTALNGTVVGTANTAITWSVSPQVGTIGNGTYTAPGTISSAQSVTVTATSQAASSRSASAVISLVPVAISLTPSTASLTSGQSATLNATVSGASNTAVNWTVSPPVGTVTNGVYTAPALVTSAQTVTVTATSAADGTKSASASISLKPSVSITLTPTTASLTGGQSTTLDATVSGTSDTGVNWSLSPSVGKVVNGVYTAPATIPSAQTITVTAASAADPTKTATANISLVPVLVTVSPSSASLTAGQSTTLKATVTGSSNTAVNWSLSPAAGTVSNGVYTAPATIASAQTITVTATSTADPTKNDTAAISLTPVSVTVSPSSASLTGGQSTTLKATVTGSSNTAVTWSISPSVGSVSNGVYTAPASIASAQTITVTAAAVADPSRSDTATISLTPVSVTVSPSSASLTGGQSTSLKATVTGSSNTAVNWSLSPAVGSVSNGVYTAPATIASAQTITVTATSGADPTRSDTAAISLTPVMVTVSPSSASLTGGQSTTLNATVTGSSNTAVNWSLSPAVGSVSNGVYTAPASIASAQTITVTATSVADPTKSDTASISLSATPTVSITVTPPTASLTAGQSATFQATVGGSSNHSVNWSVAPAVGSVANGVYTAPALIALQQTVTVAAASAADPTKVATATITLVPTVSIAVNPTTATLTGSQSMQFNASLSGTNNPNVNWSLSSPVGSLVNGLYQAPPNIDSQQTVTVTAASLADPTKTASATITLVPTVGLALTPSSISLTGGQSTQFNVTNAGAPASPTSVTWTLAPPVGNITNGVYTAPVTINSLQTVVLTIASVVDPTVTAIATINLTASTASSAPPPGTPVNLSSAYNLVGIVTDGKTFTGGLGGSSDAYSANLLGSTVNFNGSSFTLGPANALDVVTSTTVSLPAGQFSALAMLAAATNQNQPSQSFKVNYTDGTNSVFTQSLSRWDTSQNYAGESIAVKMAYFDRSTGAKASTAVNLYAYSFSLNGTKTVKSITLPNNKNVIALAITLVPPAAPPPGSVSPSTVTLNSSQTQQFAASNLGTSPKWTINPAMGSITTSGLYTAPSSVLSQATVTVTATNATDATQAASATVTLNASAVQTPPPTTITLPIEIVGPNGTTAAVTFNLPSGTNLSGLNLWMKVHGLRTQTQASIQLNNSGWQAISESNVTLLGLASAYGGIGGGFHTLTMTMPIQAGALQPGTNTITFRFNATDGRVSGFRVLQFNVQDASGNSLISSSNFVNDDPNTWQPPSTNAADITAGKNLWHQAPLTVPTATGTSPIKARCSDCHAQDGRDLKYFNYSNNSIRARSVFHGLTAQQGDQIASYIRSLNLPNPGRPWNPPYQPGPGLDSQPVELWSAGAGLDAVLDSDADMLNAMFPTGVQSAFFSPTGHVNVRETQIALQLPDWNSWLPMIHPMDAWPDFLGDAVNVRYGELRAALQAGGSAAYTNGVQSFDQWNGDYTIFMYPKTNAPLGVFNQTYVNQLYSTPLWGMVKMWELNHEFGLEGLARTVFLNPNAEDRAWRSGMPFYTSPNILHIPRGSPLFENGRLNTWVYVAFVWYQNQLILNNSEYEEHGAVPIDWGYSYAKIADLSQVASKPQTALMTLWQTKGSQLSNNGYGPDNGNGWQWQVTDISRLVTPALRSLWTGTPLATRTAIYQALVDNWLSEVSKFTPDQFYHSAHDGVVSPTQVPAKFLPDSPNFVDRVWYMISQFKYYGVNQTQINQLAAWAKTIWPLGNWAATTTATCAPSYADKTVINCSTNQ